jgi:predicted ABC-class ATPase
MGGQEVIERTAAKITSGWVEVRIYVGMPAMSRRVLARQAGAMLCDELPRIVEFSLLKENFSRKDAQYFVDSIENQEYIQSRLDAMGLIAFVADGAVLPRESGNSQKPLVGEKAVPFSSPDSLRIEITLPHSLSMISDGKRTITGMGIPKGITLIVGGGYHGKSTLLQALQRGVYPHIPGDGREYVITAKNSVKIRAEEGRRVEQVDISPFINNLPHGIDTHSFSTDNASGSTSQAANIIEALETGTAVLLLDEDTSATNFMVRDMRMQHMVAKRFEPIIPFVDRVREIYQTFHVSTILVMGGCGDYFDSADTVIMMREYLPFDATAEAKKIAADYPTNRSKESEKCRSWNLRRIPVAESFDPSRGGKAVKIDTKAVDQILFGTEMIDLRGVEQLIDASQTRAIGAMIHLASARFMDGGKSFSEILKNIENFLDENGLDVLDPFYRREKHPGSFARPRRHEIAAAVNRLRTLRMRPLKFVS